MMKYYLLIFASFAILLISIPCKAQYYYDPYYDSSTPILDKLQQRQMLWDIEDQQWEIDRLKRRLDELENDD